MIEKNERKIIEKGKRLAADTFKMMIEINSTKRSITNKGAFEYESNTWTPVDQDPSDGMTAQAPIPLSADAPLYKFDLNQPVTGEGTEHVAVEWCVDAQFSFPSTFLLRQGCQDSSKICEVLGIRTGTEITIYNLKHEMQQEATCSDSTTIPSSQAPFMMTWNDRA